MIKKIALRVGLWLVSCASGPRFTHQQHIDQLIAINHNYQKKFKEFGKAQGALGNKQGELEKRIAAIETIASRAIYTSSYPSPEAEFADALGKASALVEAK